MSQNIFLTPSPEPEPESGDDTEAPADAASGEKEVRFSEFIELLKRSPAKVVVDGASDEGNPEIPTTIKLLMSTTLRHNRTSGSFPEQSLL